MAGNRDLTSIKRDMLQMRRANMFLKSVDTKVSMPDYVFVGHFLPKIIASAIEGEINPNDLSGLNIDPNTLEEHFKENTWVSEWINIVKNPYNEVNITQGDKGPVLFVCPPLQYKRDFGTHTYDNIKLGRVVPEAANKNAHFRNSGNRMLDESLYQRTKVILGATDVRVQYGQRWAEIIAKYRDVLIEYGINEKIIDLFLSLKGVNKDNPENVNSPTQEKTQSSSSDDYEDLLQY